MQKIPTLFVRNPDNFKVTPEVTEGCGWVLAGEGVATRKYDGTCCMIDENGVYHKRQGSGWVVVTADRNDDKWHREADTTGLAPGTYELCGPKVQGNPEGFDTHVLVPHGAEVVEAPRFFEGLWLWLAGYPHEGIVWHHPDGRMAKLKGKDFPRGQA